MQAKQHELTIPPEMRGQRLDLALAELLPDYSRSRIKAWILAGQVTVNGDGVRTPRWPVQPGQQVAVCAQLTAAGDTAPEPMPLDVVYEDADLVVLNKPAGVVVHPGAGNRAGTLVGGLLHRWPALATLPRGGLVHRLDKDTTGLLLVAKTLPAHTQLVRDLQARRVRREYRAVCVGRLTAGGQVDEPIGRHPVHRTRMAVAARGRPAVTHYRVLARFPAHTFLAVRLETGRTHQIRVHLAHLHHPLVGDATYGGRRYRPPGATAELLDVLDAFRRQALHASDLALAHPRDGRSLRFHAPLPADLGALLAALAGGREPAGHFERMTWPDPNPD